VAPDNAEAWDTLGLALRATGAPDMALSAFVKAQGLRPDNLSYLLHGAEVAIETTDAQAELSRLEQACDQDPVNPFLLAGRGVLLERMGRRDEAIDALEAATVLAPDEAAPLALLAGLLARSSRLKQAEAVLRRVCLLQPGNPQALNDHAATLMKLHRHAEARSILLSVIDQFGPNPGVLCNLASTTVCLGLQDEAVAAARQAIAANPTGSLPWRTLCNVLPYHQDTRASDLLDVLRDCAAVLPRSAQPAFANSPDAERKLVIGLLSGNFRSHPVGWLTVAGIETLDPAGFDVICLTQTAALDDPITRRFRAVARDWVEVSALSDAALATEVRRRGVDILIDLGGYGDSGRMPACAHRLAPVQIKWVGMQNHSAGLPEMDWFVTDRWETPAGWEGLYTERLLRLPDGYVCYSPPPYAADVGPLPALANGFVTFGCFNNLAKVTPRVIATWAAILRRVPSARLVLKTHQFGDAATRDRMQAAFAGHGIDTERIDLRGSSGHRAFMGEYGQIDMVLDPFPYSGGLTTCEALWMGVPTITLPGDFFATRHSASHLSNAGLADWVTGAIDEYIEMAVARAADLPALAALRAGMRERVRLSPLCDAPRFGQNLGAALRQAWRVWCAG
jgi:predicted O-linked N-acetylglucosamine transferase (SPINDLY family)